MAESWKEIPGLPLYFVSDQGQVKSLNYRNTGKERVLRTIVVNGYECVRIRGKTLYVHRLVGEAFVPNPENGSRLRHKNGYNGNNAAENLEWIVPVGNAPKMQNAEERAVNASRMYFYVKTGEPKYELISGTKMAKNVETGEIKSTDILKAEGYTISCIVIVGK